MHRESTVGKRILRGVLLLILALLILFFISFFMASVEHPPKVDDLSSLQLRREKVNQNTYFLGNSWIRKSESGLYEMYIEGGAFERGVAFGRLTQELLYYQESAFTEQIRKLVPSESYLKFLKYFVAWFDRDLDKAIPEEYRTEIYGTSFSSSPSFEFIGTGYQRQLNYHAAHDIGHALKALNMVACTSFSCWGDKSADLALITGRNFDFYAGSKFSENKIVCFYKPDKGYRFMMVTWADMIGVVSGMNEKGITVTINAARTSMPLKAATPVTLLAREILQYAADIDQANKIAGERKLFVSESILVSSAKDGKSVIIEKSPEKSGIYYSGTNQLVCANHFQSNTFLNDQANVENLKGSDSKYRFDRVNELLKREKSIDVAVAVSILRDRKGPGNTDPGMGNPMVVNQLIAHHSVVFKPASLVAWISTDPYQLGKYVAYDLNKVFKIDREQITASEEIYSPELTIPADTFLYSTGYNNYTKYLSFTEELNNYKKRGEKLPETFEAAYVATNPEFYLTYANLGSYYFENKEYKRAYDYYKKALTKEIPGEDEENKLKGILKKVLKKQKNAYSGN
jgi:predicted choloylglycine hydrolase